MTKIHNYPYRVPSPGKEVSMDSDNHSGDQVMMVTGLAFPLGHDWKGQVVKFKY